MSNSETYDVVVVGSGAAGATAALRAASLGLSTIIVEKSPKFGGTSATSGGVIWVPNHDLTETDDTRESVEEYLAALIDKDVKDPRIQSYLDNAPEMVKFVTAEGCDVQQAAWPDYHQKLPGARSDRSLIFGTFDGMELGDMFTKMREQFTRFKVMNRYSMDVMQFFSLSTFAPGWRTVFIKMWWTYWTDFAVRKFTRRDRRFTMGAALAGHLYKQVFKYGVEIRLDSPVKEILVEDGKVAGVEVDNFGRKYEIKARHGVVLCSGGFEWSQELREKFLEVKDNYKFTSTPEHANAGEVLKAGMKIGADTEHTEAQWWMPTMEIPMPKASNYQEIHQAAFDVGRPHSVCVNRNGDRFVDEATGYDEFGKAMVADHLKTGANMPCWHVFDSQFRGKFPSGGILPKILLKDEDIPVDWWDHYIFKANSVQELAAKIHVPADKLVQTITNMNEYAKTGVDPEFGRGDNAYDQMFGHASASPNPCLAPISEGPFYAVPIHAGDLGSKGGLKCDGQARVIDTSGNPIPGLYAAGNQSGNPFGNWYPGAGGTIGPAMTFGFVAANDIAQRAGNQTS